MTSDVLVLEEPERAKALLDPTRLALLEHLSEPLSAAALARKLGEPRQRLNYHLRELESRGLIELVEERVRGNASERIYRRSSASYAVSTAALGVLGSSPDKVADRFSSGYQIAVASQAIADLARLRAGAEAAGQTLATLTLDTRVRFADAASRSAFAAELTDAVAALVAKYHDESAPNGRAFKLFAGAYPEPKRATGA